MNWNRLTGQLATKAVTALNAVYDILEPAIPDLSPKERVSLLPKAVLTLNQAAANVNLPPPSIEQGCRDEENGKPTSDDFEKEQDVLDRLFKYERMSREPEMPCESNGSPETASKTGCTKAEM